MSGRGVAVARAQWVEPAVLLDELEKMVEDVTGRMLATPAARERWAARLRAFRELRAENARLHVRLEAGREARKLQEELAEV